MKIPAQPLPHIVDETMGYVQREILDKWRRGGRVKPEIAFLQPGRCITWRTEKVADSGEFRNRLEMYPIRERISELVTFWVACRPSGTTRFTALLAGCQRDWLGIPQLGDTYALCIQWEGRDCQHRVWRRFALETHDKVIAPKYSDDNHGWRECRSPDRAQKTFGLKCRPLGVLAYRLLAN